MCNIKKYYNYNSSTTSPTIMPGLHLTNPNRKSNNTNKLKIVSI